MKKLVKLSGGEIFAIPLFLSDEKSTKSFSRDKFEDRGKDFVFCRIIEDRGGSGLLIEVFDLVSGLDESLENIISSNRLLPVIPSTGIGIYKKRWKKLYEQSDYDKEQHSNYSNIKIALQDGDSYSLWQNGKEIEISESEAQKYESWKVWLPSQLEKRIIRKLFGE